MGRLLLSALGLLLNFLISAQAAYPADLGTVLSSYGNLSTYYNLIRVRIQDPRHDTQTWDMD